MVPFVIRSNLLLVCLITHKIGNQKNNRKTIAIQGKMISVTLFLQIFKPYSILEFAEMCPDGTKDCETEPPSGWTSMLCNALHF